MAGSDKRRRDNDPVRINADGRIFYWTGGAPGLGRRRSERTRNREEAEARAEEIRETLAMGLAGDVPDVNRTLDDLCQAFIDQHREDGTPEGTVRQYLSDWNTWVPDNVGETEARQVTFTHWRAIFDGMVQGDCTPERITAVNRTIGAATKWGSLRGWFGAGEPWGAPTRRAEFVRDAKRRARQKQGAATVRSYAVSECPSWDDILELADALEELLPGRGRNAVVIAAATGVRGGELLGLKVDDIDLETGVVRVERQLARRDDWPATTLPKGSKVRETIVWAHAIPYVEDAIANAHEDGWLFPKPEGSRANKWLTKFNKLVEQARNDIDWAWTFHWTRHHFCSVGVAPATAGGYGLEAAAVARWAGHADLSTFLNYYIQPQSTSASHAFTATARLPGGDL